MAMYPCEKCLENKWKFQSKRDIAVDEKSYTKFTLATCEFCGNEVEFGHKEKKIKVPAIAEYKIIDGKRFLKIDGVFQEVGLFNVNKHGEKDPDGKALRVLPI